MEGDRLFNAGVQGCASYVEELIRSQLKEEALDVKTIKETYEKLRSERKRIEAEKKKKEEAKKEEAKKVAASKSVYRTARTKKTTAPAPVQQEKKEEKKEEDPFMIAATEELNKAKISVGTKLGNGAFGEVWSGEMNGKKIAIKFMQKMDEETEKEVLNELSLMGNFKHHFLLGHEKYVPEIPAIILEMADGGSIEDCLKSRDTPIGWGLRMKWAVQISEGLVALHNAGLIHRDLRIPNILLTADLDVKIADFGVSTRKLWPDRELPFYSSGSLFDLLKHKDTFDYIFDCRLYGIVLVQLLLCGENMGDVELYDWKTKKVSRSLPCDREDYWALIDLCFYKDVNSCKLASLARSISAHFCGGKFHNDQKQEPVQIEPNPMTLPKIKEATKHLARMIDTIEEKEKASNIIHAIVQMTAQYNTNHLRHYIAKCLATIPPQVLVPYLEAEVEEEEVNERYFVISENFRSQFDAAYDDLKKLSAAANENSEAFKSWNFKKSLDHLRLLYGQPVKSSIEVLHALVEATKNVPIKKEHRILTICALIRLGEYKAEWMDELFGYLHDTDDTDLMWWWQEIIRAFSETKDLKESAERDKVIAELKKKLVNIDNVKDRRYQVQYQRAKSDKSEINVSLALLGVKEDEVVNQVRQCWLDDGMKENYSFPALATLGVWDEDIKKQFIQETEHQSATFEKKNILYICKAVRSFALLHLTDHDVEACLVPLLKHHDPNLRTSAAHALHKGDQTVHEDE
eukprot:TRINITY_DN9154_c0_g1_i1.p1 TRINITY_DN9154_c0_g1~~TRINITY_DN9154_c0_g1_i1.p1  ORF type:complete len:745 (-),score=201.82 TRINITY_DN9154_c0_g1_i1:74-2308(-)